MVPIIARPIPQVTFLEAFLVSAAVVAVGEIGDKTQLLALVLAARFRKPAPIIAGIFVATLFNHGLAGLVGEWIRASIDPAVLRWILGVSFLAIAAWALVPDKLEEKDSAPMGKYGVFAVTLVAFFLAEIGDKTQLATVALAARFDSLVAVVAGTTVGMLIADVPAVLLGGKASVKLPLKAIRYVAAALFAVLGVAVLAGVNFG
jgi:putative Ca2+/H+ antiporter (TMEM165/GDT1 family)